MRNTFIELAIQLFIASLITFIITYIYFQSVTDSGFTFVYQNELNKPYVTNWFGNLGTMFLGSSIISLIIANVFYKT